MSQEIPLATCDVWSFAHSEFYVQASGNNRHTARFSSSGMLLTATQ